VTVRTYTTEQERQAALAAARQEYTRTGVLHTPVPAALAAHEATRHGPAPFGVIRPAPTPAPGPAVTGEQVAAVVREAVASIDDAQAQSYAARRLREAGADRATVSAAMRQVAAERAARRDPGW
jgi:hypothetical protein